MNATLKVPALSLLLLLSACAEKAPAPPETYEIAGEVVRLPAAGDRQIVVKHEAIPGFKDESGKVVGMEAMTMPFAVAEGVSLDGLAPGDKVEFTLEVRWASDKEPVRIVRLAESALIHSMDMESGAMPAGQPEAAAAPPPAETPK
jgi:Cu/Ag efflux protein CusF